MWQYNYSDELYHHRVKGMKWGVRRRGGAKQLSGAPKKVNTKKIQKSLYKQYGTLEDAAISKRNPTTKDMHQAYGKIDSSLNGTGNKKASAYAEKALAEIDRQLSSNAGSKNPTYNATKINNYLDSALNKIDNDLNKYR